MLLVRIRRYLKSFLRNTFLILDTCHPDTLYLREQGCENPWLFFETRSGPWAKTFEKHCSLSTPQVKCSLLWQAASYVSATLLQVHTWNFMNEHLKFAIASFLLHSAVYSSYKHIKLRSKAVPLYATKAYGGIGGTAPRIGNSTILRRPVSFTQRPFYFHTKCPFPIE
jgi:hypothetical protein